MSDLIERIIDGNAGQLLTASRKNHYRENLAAS